MKILALKAQNILNLKAVEISADGKSITLSGRNGAGKSAILDAIFMALTGKKVDQPVRQGEEQGRVVVTLDNFVVTRTWGKGEGLRVTSPDGKANYQSPQALLNEILGEIAFNPIQFAELGKTAAGMRQQRETLMKLSKLDFSEIDEQLAELIAERTAKNRDLKKQQAVFETMVTPEPNLPAKEISMQDELLVIDKLEKQRESFLEYERLQEASNVAVSTRRKDVLDSESEIKELQEKIENLRSLIEIKNEEIRLIEADKVAAVKPIQVTAEQISDAKKSLAGIEEKNRKIRHAANYAIAQKALSQSEAEAVHLTNRITELTDTKSERIKTATYPLAGLAVNDECVLFNNVPLSQQSTGLQMKISTAIAMALNPKLRVILLRDAALLDSEGLKAIVEMAEAQDYQLWIEKVDDSGQVGIFIEDGAIKAIDGQPQTQGA